MPTVLDSLLVRLGFSVDLKGLEGFAKNVEDLKSKAEGLKHFAEVYLGFEGLKKAGEFIKSSIEGMAGVQDFSERVDMSARSVAALGRVAQEHDSSLEAMEGTISSLNAVLGQAASGFPRAEKMLSRFGLKAKDAHGQVKTFDQILADVAEKMETAGTGKRLAMANALGIDPKLIPLLKEGVENFERLRDDAMNANPFSNNDYERAEKTEKLFQKAEGSFDRLKQRLAIGLLPTVTQILNKFIAWVSDSKNIAKIQGYIDSVVKVAKLLWENARGIASIFGILMAHKYGTMFLEWWKSIGKFVVAVKDATSASKSLALAFTGVKAAITGGLLGLLGLLIEDLFTFEKGGRSVTGWMVNDFTNGAEIMKLAIGGIAASAIALVSNNGALALIVVGFAAWFFAIQSIRKEWPLLVQEIERGFKRISDNPAFKALDYLLEKLQRFGGGGGITGTGEGPGKEEASAAIDKLRGQGPTSDIRERFDKRSWWDKYITGKGQEGINAAVDANATRGGIGADWMAPGAGVFADFDRAPAWRMDRVPSVQSSVSKNQITFHINGVIDPKAVAAEVERKLNSIDLSNAGKRSRNATRNAQSGTR